jgi:hypothetical protein
MKETMGETIAIGDASTPRFAMNWPRVRPNTAGYPKIATNAVGISPTFTWYAKR